MNDVKGFFESKTIWGGLIGFLAGLAGLLGYSIAPEDAEALTGIITGGAGTFGALLAIWGRIKASKKIE